MDSKIPKIKKKVNAFLVGEEGKISKHSLLKGAVTAGIISAGTLLASKGALAQQSHSNTLSVSYASPTATGTHAHHASHSNHSNHANHSNHGSHSSHGSHGSHGSHNSW